MVGEHLTGAVEVPVGVAGVLPADDGRVGAALGSVAVRDCDAHRICVGADTLLNEGRVDRRPSCPTGDQGQAGQQAENSDAHLGIVSCWPQRDSLLKH